MTYLLGGVRAFRWWRRRLDQVARPRRRVLWAIAIGRALGRMRLVERPRAHALSLLLRRPAARKIRVALVDEPHGLVLR